jgi:hypothetical protein
MLIYWDAKIVRPRAMPRAETVDIDAGHGVARCHAG